MSAKDRTAVITAIKDFCWAGLQLSPSSGEHEVRVSVPAAELLGFADYLQSRFEGRPELIVAEDTSAASAGFTRFT